MLMDWICFNVLRKGDEVEQHYSVLFKLARLCWRVSPGLAQWVNDVGEGLAYYRMRRWAHSQGDAKATGFLANGLIPGLIALDYRGRSDEWLWGYLADAFSIAGDHARRNANALKTDAEWRRAMNDHIMKGEHTTCA